jgi:hypothetical protein
VVAEAAGLVEVEAVVVDEEVAGLVVVVVVVDEEVAPEARVRAATAAGVSAEQGTLPRCRVLPHDLN